MNKNEKRMVEILKQLSQEFSVAGVKAEFEAEGTRTEELMRLRDIALQANVDFTLKIGGGDAVRDMYDAKSVGIDHLLAPMVESPFALQKYLRSVDTVFSDEEKENIHFLINVETVGTVELFTEMLKIPEIKKLDGIVVGRGDLVESLGFARTEVDNEKSFHITQKIVTLSKEHGLETVVGGGISINSLPFLRNLPTGTLDRYETRKVCFSCPGALGEKASRGIELALEFELYWLSNKRNYYRAISVEDQSRIDTLEKRLAKKV